MTRLNQREKVMIYAAAGFIGIFVIFQFGVFPLVDKRERLQRALVAKTRTVTEIEAPPLSDALQPQLRTRLEALVETVRNRRSS